MHRRTVRCVIIELRVMNNEIGKQYWRSPAERDGTAGPESALPDAGGTFSFSRRQFLEAAGFSLSLAAFSGCSRQPVKLALPLVNQPEGLIPGRKQSFASTCAGCSAGCGLLVSVRDGRPLKMEGMPEHPASRGGLCAVGQAQPLGLYDSQRLQQPLHLGKPVEWKAVDESLQTLLDDLATQEGAVRFVTGSVTSPTLQATIDGFLSRFKDAKHVVFDAVSNSAILDAHEKTHGARLLPRYRLERAKTIVSLGADFLGTWIAPVEFTAAWRTRRTPTEAQPEMSFHVQLEGRMSLTGSNADQRYRLAPDEYGILLSHLLAQLADRAGQSVSSDGLDVAPVPNADFEDMVKRLVDHLWAARGESVVLCDSQDVAVQILVNAINNVLGNYGRTVDIDRPSRQRQGNDRDVLDLIQELRSGKVAALFVAGSDLTHDLPDSESVAKAIGEVPLVVSFSTYSGQDDGMAALAHYVCPDHHPLESWLDAEPIDGLVSLSQPTLQPLGKTRSILESLTKWSGQAGTAYDIVRDHWDKKILPRASAQPFQKFWDQSLHDGFAEVEPVSKPAGDFQHAAVKLLPGPSHTSGYNLALYAKVGLPDSRHAHNPWLQELPDPVTKVTWDNYVCISQRVATDLKLEDGDLVQLTASGGAESLELPVLIQPGQHDRVVAVALGYGVRGTERFHNIGPDWLEARPTVAAGERVGKNAAELSEARNGTLQYTRHGVMLTKMNGRRDLASTQLHHTLKVPARVAPHGAEVRDIVQETTLSAFEKNAESGRPEHHDFGKVQLWAEDHPKDGHSWGMSIDLNACTGCSACLIACQSENNVPVVGKDEVRRQREMHWIRIDRYYSGEGDDLDVAHQPMMCQHCDNAPCETVCPVLATAHSEEGLNAQVYNRCVGTRYCANNCPYKVRRFNWFNYSHDDDLQNLVLNPDVTVRSRGVMEKCSMCVQRIEEGKIDAKGRGEPLADGNIQTACQQSCPAQAIVFGDMNDADSRLHKALEDPRRFGVLEEFNFRPRVSYQRIVRNSDDFTADHDAADHDAADHGTVNHDGHAKGDADV